MEEAEAGVEAEVVAASKKRAVGPAPETDCCNWEWQHSDRSSRRQIVRHKDYNTAAVAAAAITAAIVDRKMASDQPLCKETLLLLGTHPADSDGKAAFAETCWSPRRLPEHLPAAAAAAAASTTAAAAIVRRKMDAVRALVVPVASQPPVCLEVLQLRTHPADSEAETCWPPRRRVAVAVRLPEHLPAAAAAVALRQRDVIYAEEAPARQCQSPEQVASSCPYRNAPPRPTPSSRAPRRRYL